MGRTTCFALASLGALALTGVPQAKAQYISQTNEFAVEVDDRSRHYIGCDTTHFFWMGYNPNEAGFNTTAAIKFWYVKNGQKMHSGEFQYQIYQYSMPGNFQGAKQWQWVGKPWELARMSMPPDPAWIPCEIHFKYNITSVIYYKKDGTWQSNADTWYSGVWIKTLNP